MNASTRISVCGIAVLWLAGVAAGQPAADAQPAQLQAILDRIHQHAANDAWRNESFRDDPIEAWLDRLVGSIAKAAFFPELKLPVRLANVKPADLGPTGLRTGALIVAKDIVAPNTTFIDSILLADGQVDVGTVQGCAVVGRHAVSVKRSNYSVLVGGAFVNITQADGSPSNRSNGSVVVTRGWAEVGSAGGTLIAAAQGVAVREAAGARLINQTAQRRGGGFVPVPVHDLPLEALPAHPLFAEVKVEGLVHGKRSTSAPPRGVVFRYTGRRYIAEFDQPILDQKGSPVAALADWRVRFANETLAVFSNDTADVALPLAGSP